MNEEQKIVGRALERAHQAIANLEREKGRDVSGEIVSYREEMWMLQNEEFMNGFFESREEVKRHERMPP